jgi:putative DNA-invertase from lambdoid prophage Rac
MQILIYARVSRDDGTQNPTNQTQPLTEWAARLGGEVVGVEVDQVSGKSGANRPALDRVFQLAHERRFDTLLVAALDRLSRGGIETTARMLRQLNEYGVAVQSMREPWLYQTDPHIRSLLIAVFSWIGEVERHQIITRTKAGMARARRAGVRLGRPMAIDADQARRALAKCGTLRAAARELGCDAKTVKARLQA